MRLLRINRIGLAQSLYEQFGQMLNGLGAAGKQRLNDLFGEHHEITVFGGFGTFHALGPAQHTHFAKNLTLAQPLHHDLLAIRGTVNIHRPLLNHESDCAFLAFFVYGLILVIGLHVLDFFGGHVFLFPMDDCANLIPTDNIVMTR